MIFVSKLNYLITSSNDNKIVVWKIALFNSNSFVKYKELTDHSNSVSSLISIDELLASCSIDNTVKIWNLKHFKLIASYNFKMPLTYLQIIKKSEIIIAAGNNKLNVLIKNKNFYFSNYKTTKIQIFSEDILMSTDEKGSIEKIKLKFIPNFEILILNRIPSAHNGNKIIFLK